VTGSGVAVEERPGVGGPPLSETLKATGAPAASAPADPVSPDSVQHTVADARTTQPDGTDAASSLQAAEPSVAQGSSPVAPPSQPGPAADGGGRFASTLVSRQVPEAAPPPSYPPTSERVGDVAGPTAPAAESSVRFQPGIAAFERRRGLDATVVSPVMDPTQVGSAPTPESPSVQIAGQPAPPSSAPPPPALPASAFESPGFDAGDTDFARELRGGSRDWRKPALLGVALLVVLIIIVAAF
jgi:hypothetical protein